MNSSQLRNLAYQCLHDLSTAEGFTASARNEAFGCIFGRDSAITILKILKVHKKVPSESLLAICKKTLQTLVALQGKTINIESGEEPGKFIHEFRPDRYEYLTSLANPWYVYDDGKLRNYDSVDATPLTLIALYRYWQVTGDTEFFMSSLTAVEAGLNWIITYGDKDKDLLLEYELPKDRKHGGLVVQSWSDSRESIATADGKMPLYPIAPIEVQAFAWLAMKLWADFYTSHYPSFGQKLQAQAKLLQKRFSQAFLIKDQSWHYGLQALDGNKAAITTVTANPLLCLWATYNEAGKKEAIISPAHVDHFVTRAFQADLFDEDAGIRTMSTKSPTYNPRQDSYHNGSFWPMINGLVHEGLEHWGYSKEANRLKEASLKPLAYFRSPVELYVKGANGAYLEYREPSGKAGCRVQAWSAAAALDWTT